MRDISVKTIVPSITPDTAAELLNKKFATALSEFQLIPDELVYCSWPETFGSTSGPFGGIGGQALTEFRMEAWTASGYAVIFCGGRILRVTNDFNIGARWRPSK